MVTIQTSEAGIAQIKKVSRSIISVPTYTSSFIPYHGYREAFMMFMS